ncbi:hypothetical protein DFJ74DRAFT_654002 [Hyaloraphidium curvatum]|nr:hypothetical protein DFJ74DRAFT_654002 [Hyaloraphidium curvatum]
MDDMPAASEDSAPAQLAEPPASATPSIESAETRVADQSPSGQAGAPVPLSPTSARESTPQTALPVAPSSAGSTAGSDSGGNQLVDTLHIVATDRNSVDKFDLYELFSVQDGFQRIAWQNEGYSFVKFTSHEHAIACLRTLKRQMESGMHDKLSSIKITVAKMSYVPNYKVPTADDFAASATLHLSHFPKDSTVLELRRFFSRCSPEGFERLIFHINYCHVLFKDVEHATRTKDLVNKTTNFVLAFAKNVTDMKSRIHANGAVNGVGADFRHKANGGQHPGMMQDDYMSMGRPRPFPGNAYHAYGQGFNDVASNQSYMNFQNRDYERRNKIQAAQAQMRSSSFGAAPARGSRDAFQQSQGYDGYPGEYPDRMPPNMYGRPATSAQGDYLDRSGAGGFSRYNGARYRSQSYEVDPNGFRDDSSQRRMLYGNEFVGNGMPGNVDWAVAAMQKAAATGGAGGWDSTDLMRLQQQQALAGRGRNDYDFGPDPSRSGYQQRGQDPVGDPYQYDMQQRQMRAAYGRNGPAAFYDPSQQAYYSDYQALPGMARMPAMGQSSAQSFDRTIRPPARRMSNSGDDLAGAFSSILQPNGQDDLAQITSSFQNSFGLGDTVS